MKASANKKLNEVVFDVFEKLAFMFGDVADREEVSPTATDYAHVSMTFSGKDMAGTLALTVPAELSMQIAANVLGVDPADELADAQADDALKELLNVICGNVLTAIAGEKPVFDLTVPVASNLDADGWSSLLYRLDTHAFLIDDVPVLIQFRCEGFDQ